MFCLLTCRICASLTLVDFAFLLRTGSIHIAVVHINQPKKAILSAKQSNYRLLTALTRFWRASCSSSRGGEGDERRSQMG